MAETRIRRIQVDVESSLALQSGEAVASACVFIYQIVLAATKQFKETEGRQHYVTPAGFIDLIDIYAQVGCCCFCWWRWKLWWSPLQI